MSRQRKRPPEVDMDKVAKGLGAKRGTKLKAGAGYFGALQTAANRPPIEMPDDEQVSRRVTVIMRHIFGPKWKGVS